MRLLFAFFIFLATLLGLKYQPFLKVEGFSAEGGIGVEKLELHIGNFSLFVGGLRYRNGVLSAEVVSVDLPPPPPRYAEEIEKPDYGELRGILTTALGWLKRIPIRLKVKDTYIRAGEISVNLYRLGVSEGEISLLYGELFFPDNRSLVLENLSLSGDGSYAILSGDYRFEHLRGEATVSADPLEGRLEVFSIGRFGGRPFSLKGVLKLSSTLRGTLTLKSQKGVLEGNFTLKGFRLNLNLKGELERTKLLSGGGFNLYPSVDGSLRGKLEGFCNRTLSYTLSLGGDRLSLALLDTADFTYISTDIPFGGIWEAVGSLGNGSLQLVGTPPDLSLRLTNATVRDFCNLTAEGVNLSLQTRKGKAVGFLSSNRLEYPPLSVGEEEIDLLAGDGRITLSFGGSLKGLLALRDGNLWGYLSGKVSVKGKPLEANIPLVELLSDGKKRKANLWLEHLSWDDLEVEDIRAFATAGGKLLNLSLRGSAEGEITYRGGNYRADLSVWFFQRGNPRRFALKAEGNPREGRGKLHLEELNLSYTYKRRGNTFTLSEEGNWKFISFKGQLEYGDRVRVRETLSLGPNPSGLTAVATLLGEGDKRLNTFEGKILPFCLNLTGEKVACFQTGLLKKEGKDFHLRLESVGGFPLYGRLKLDILKGERIDIDTLLKVKTSLLNRYLSAYGTYAEEPKEISIPFSYSGKISDLSKKLSWSYTLRLKLFSAYLYKPIISYITLAAFGGNFSGMVGIADATSGTAYGSLSVSLSPKGFEADGDFSDLPLRVSLPETLRGYLNVGVHLKVKKSGKRFLVRGRLLSGGFLKVLSYNFPTSKGGGEKQILLLESDVSFLSSEPLFVETPDGKFTLNYRGSFRNGTLKAEVAVDYGELQLLGKTFYIHGGEVSVNGERVFLDMPMVYYAPGRTVYLRIYGFLPWENLKFEIYSTPPAPEEELLASLLSGGGANTATNMPLAKVLLQGATMGLAGVVNRLSSALISGVTVKFEPSFDPTTGFAVGVDVEKRFDDIAKIGYHWFPSPNPKATYLWGSMKFFYNTYIRGVRYSDGSNSLLLRFAKEFGLPF